LLPQAMLQAYEQALLLVVIVVAAVTLLALLVTLVGLCWQLSHPATTRTTELAATPKLTACNAQPTIWRITMKRLVLLITTLFLLTFVAQAQTQDNAVNNGPVWRISEYRIKPDKGQEHLKFLREHRTVILAEQKRQGLILDYKFFHNDATAGPHEVHFVEAICYRNYSDALDSGSNAERTQKMREITEKHYGSLENARKAGEQFQTTRDVVRGYVLHEMTINPLKATAAGN
jgi:hypothetical protein